MMVETPTIDQQFLDEQIVNFADYRAMIWHPMLLENGSLLYGNRSLQKISKCGDLIWQILMTWFITPSKKMLMATFGYQFNCHPQRATQECLAGTTRTLQRMLCVKSLQQENNFHKITS